MGLSVTTVGTSRRLAHRSRIATELGITADATLDALIDQYSAAIEAFCRRQFAREAYEETLPGFGDIHLALARTPVVSVSTVTSDADQANPVTDYSIANKDQGLLYRRAGWAWTTQIAAGLTGWQSWPGQGIPLPRQEEPSYTVDYVAGYIVPAQNIIGATTISAALADSSFNDSGNGFPPLLKAGDVIRVSGFSSVGNNGRFLVSGTPTTSKIVVSGTLAVEAAGPTVTIVFEPPAGCRPMDDVEAACGMAVKAAYLARASDPRIIEKHAGPVGTRFSDMAYERQGLPSECIGLLRPWVRWAS